MNHRHGISVVARFLRWSVSLLILTILILLTYVYSPVLISPADNYTERKGSIKSATITREWQERGSYFSELDLESDSGLYVQITIRIPEQSSTPRTDQSSTQSTDQSIEPLPVALLLGGVGTGRSACHIIPQIKHVICVSISYPYRGTKNIEGLGFIYNLRDLQQVVKDTPPAMMLALDYVLSQPYSDTNQVELLGVSFGAYFISIPAVLDSRVTRVWIAHGAAEPIKVMIHNYYQAPDRHFVNKFLTHLVGYAIGSQHVDPEKWVGRISPRPVILINAERDKTFPDSSIAALHHAARQPKEVIWTKGVHVTPGRKEIVKQISDLVLNRMESEFQKRRVNNR